MFKPSVIFAGEVRSYRLSYGVNRYFKRPGANGIRLFTAIGYD